MESPGIVILAATILGSLFLCHGGDDRDDEESSSGLWTLIAPEDSTHALFSEDRLTDEVCANCALADLEGGGTKLRPLSSGCQRVSWDPTYVYCHVQAAKGELHGARGWVNEEFIDK